MKKIVNSQKDHKKGSLTLTLRKSQGGGKEDGTPHVRQGKARTCFGPSTSHQVPPSMYYVLGSLLGSLFLRLSERSKAKALLVPCSVSVTDIQLSQWIMRQYGHPGNSKPAKRELAQIVANVGDETGNSKEARQPHWALQAAACLPASLVSRECCNHSHDHYYC